MDDVFSGVSEMNKIEEIKALIAEIKIDRKQLDKEGQLTERGRGHLDMVKMIEEILNK